MTSSEFDPFDAFFTPERRSYYRELQERFPLWCGSWPDDASTFPEALGWRPYLVAPEIIEAGPQGLLGYDFPEEASEDHVPVPRFHVEDFNLYIPEAGDYALEFTTEIEPPLLGVLAAAANYVFVPWGTDLPKHGLGTGAGTDHALANAARRAVLQAGVGLETARRDYLRARDPNSRDCSRRELEAAWREVGKQSGILPSAKGGVVCALPNVTLQELTLEASGIVKSVLSYVPDAAMLGQLRNLAKGEKNLSQREREMLRSLQRQQHPPPEPIERLEAKIDAAIDSPALARRLSFPMLTRSEIQQIVRDSGGRTNQRTVEKVAADLVAGRLPITKKTLLHRIAQV